MTEAPPAEPVTLKIYLLDYTPDTIAWLKSEINPAFEAAHPGATVEITEGSWSGWDTIFSGFFAAGEGPDIINLGSEMNTLYGESLADMDAYLGEAAWPDIKNFGPALENAKYQGKLRGLPIFTAPRYVFCRTDLMEAAGWTSGTPQNFAEWVDFAGKASVIDAATNSLTQQALVPVDAGSMADWQWWLLVYFSLGGQLYKADGSPNFDSPEALATTQFLLDLRQAIYGPAVNAVGALPAGQGSVIDVNDETAKDNGAVCLAHSGWAAPPFDRPIWEKVSIDPFFGDPDNFPNSKPVVLAFNDWLAVADYSPNKELAAEWLKMAFSMEANHKWNETMSLIPARNDAQYGYVTDSPQLKREAELAAQYGVGFAGIEEAAKLSTMMIPPQALIVPQYVFFNKLGWVGTFNPIIIPGFFAGGAAMVFLLRQSMAQIPKELDEAAFVDGANHLQIFWEVVMPLVKAPLATVATFLFVGFWNSLLAPLMYLQTIDLYTLPVYVSTLYNINLTVQQWPTIMSAAVLTTVPLIIVFFFAQRFILESVVISGLKG